MECLIFLADTVSRNSISHSPDPCWTLVTLVSRSAVFYNSKQVLRRSVLSSEVSECPPCPRRLALLASVGLPRWGVDGLLLRLSILVTWGIHWEWILPSQELVRMLEVFFSQFWEKCEVSLNGNYKDLSTAKESSLQSFLFLLTQPLSGESFDWKYKAAL